MTSAFSVFTPISTHAQHVARTLRTADAGIKSLLELGSGTGQHGRLLASGGFNVFGVERSEAIVKAARGTPVPHTGSGRGSFECKQGDIRSVKLDRTFDAVLALFHVVSYQIRSADLMQTFASAARHLRPRGVFLFDVWHGPAVLTERPSMRVKRVEDERTRLTRIAEPELDINASVVTVKYTVLAKSKIDGRLTTLVEEHPMRYFFPVG